MTGPPLYYKAEVDSHVNPPAYVCMCAYMRACTRVCVCARA